MRIRIAALVLVLLPACGGEESVVSVAGFTSRSPRVVCEALPGPRPPAALVTRLAPATDSTFLLIDEGNREVVELDAGLGRVRAVTFTEDGPRGVARMADAAIAGDTLLVVADMGRNRLRGFTGDGEPRWTLNLPFPPQRTLFTGDRLLVAPVGMDRRVTSLLYEVRDSGIHSLAVPPASDPDALARMFINSVNVQAWPDGDVLVAHQFVLARAWHVGRDDRPRQRTVPVPDRVAAAVGVVPPMPIREEDLARMAVPVIDFGVDGRTGGIVYLTRSGDRREGGAEKAFVRADRDLGYVASSRLAINAVAFAYLPAHPDSVIVVDADQAWHRCPVP